MGPWKISACPTNCGITAVWCRSLVGSIAWSTKSTCKWSTFTIWVFGCCFSNHSTILENFHRTRGNLTYLWNHCSVNWNNFLQFLQFVALSIYFFSFFNTKIYLFIHRLDTFFFADEIQKLWTCGKGKISVINWIMCFFKLNFVNYSCSSDVSSKFSTLTYGNCIWLMWKRLNPDWVHTSK